MSWLIVWAMCSCLIFGFCVSQWDGEPEGDDIFATFVLTALAPLVLIFAAFEWLCRALYKVVRR